MRMARVNSPPFVEDCTDYEHALVNSNHHPEVGQMIHQSERTSHLINDVHLGCP